MRLRFRHFGANLWARAFLRNCRRQMRDLAVDRAEVQRAIRDRAQALFDQRFDALPDKKARSILAMCSLVLAACEALEKHTAARAAAFDAVRRAFAATGSGPLVWLVKVYLWWHRDPVEDLQGRSFVEQGRRMYGQSMQFAEEKTDESADMLVTRCAFHQFFVDHGRPELTVLVCAWDRNWMDVVDRSGRPIRTERPSTISTGGECCRFRFIRDAHKDALEERDVVLVQIASRSRDEELAV
jgi:hypothetical protein